MNQNPTVTVLLASPRSYCAGVERAIKTVERALEHATGPVYVRKQIVHNLHVVAELARRGAIFVDELDDIPPGDGATVVFSAHGVSPAVRAEADRRGLAVIDATCPLVRKVHHEAERFARAGDAIVLVGHAGHEEAEGTLGVAPDATVLVQTAQDVATLDLPADKPVSVLTQTTLAVDETTEVIDALRARYPELKTPASEDICYATTNRQNAVRAVIGDADILLVLGSANSSNSQRLVELSLRAGTPAYLIDSAADLKPDMLAHATTIGVTAGASTPPELVDQVVDVLRARGPVQVLERETTTETMRFAPPRQLPAQRQGQST
ncbi:4-hydroxy-3-methylbut-2-enyl diphosphate reductase (plasmid) [Nocardia sp. CA-084685]|uniref:4-hydroxy-3-methylbut-2-enyl diphosphate reductase n=1 Tax=Nocardia sp. CA-084685 TaxID=3239970 RepID=UPI003D970E56